MFAKMLKNDGFFEIFMKFLEESSRSWKSRCEEISVKENLSSHRKSGDLLYEFPAETRLTVYRRLNILENTQASR